MLKKKKLIFQKILKSKNIVIILNILILVKLDLIYQCKYPNQCKVYISFNLENIKNLIDNDKDGNTIIEYQYNNKNTHKCVFKENI